MIIRNAGTPRTQETATPKMERTIHADKAGIIEHLEELAQPHRAAGRNARLLRDRRYESGVAAGLNLAIGVLRDWKEDDASDAG